MNYQMNAGYLAPDDWLRTAEGGGCNLGEACHIHDLFSFLTDSQVVDVKTACVSPADHAHARNENFITTITFDDGSMGSLTYTSLGSKRHPKELLHVYVDGTVHALTDYLRMETFGGTVETTASGQTDKGHFVEMQAFVGAIRDGREWPIPLWHQLQASRIALTVEQQTSGKVEADET